MSVSAISTRIAVGQSVNITCSVSRSVPNDSTIEWTLTDTSSTTTTTLDEDGEMVVITNIMEDEFGTYTCTAMNSADLSGSANITIEEGCKMKHVYVMVVILLFYLQIFQKSA